MEIQISHQAKKCKLPKKSSKRNQNTKLPSFHNSSTISSFNASRNIIFQESSYKRSWVHTRVRGQGLNRAFLHKPGPSPCSPSPPHRSFPSLCRPARCLSLCLWISLSLSLSLCVCVIIGLATNVLPLALHMFVQYDVVSHLTCKWPFRV
jgi:hypothetical protein